MTPTDIKAAHRLLTDIEAIKTTLTYLYAVDTTLNGFIVFVSSPVIHLGMEREHRCPPIETRVLIDLYESQYTHLSSRLRALGVDID